MTNLLIRKMSVDDIEEVSAIENESFTVPWSKKTYQDELTLNQYANYFVILSNDVIVGFCGMWLVIDEAQITNIAIRKAYRGKRFGEALFQYVLNYAIAHHASRLSLEVRVSNLVAQRLYKKFGLVPGGIRRNYYTDNQEDALVLWVNL
ncbi:ribosomal protein S18-alanine N-acetyltransferase [Saliterribacillus persicus]|uniref:[Ribosomal protein bS18]-alanine N-acetyltransferase n=1 Tax=Saliterribacillus persicus TaxID=930114 RepID=A0A368X5D5_9BACI|nr:ribosomal protein S18-alanine N-acetyltransferase [Saliterribacillus persicus]RCW62198.1 [SSU ribosomal protein S18P]-alanine acetyltransferase [Saliterribacillus persicus]